VPAHRVARGAFIGYRAVMASDTGLLVVNLGTPDAPTPEAVRRFLAEFLSDRRVVDLPRLPWQLVLRTVILPFRPAKSARAYGEIWTPAGSPLLTGTEALVRALEHRLAGLLAHPPAVAMGMTYGNPSLSRALESLEAAGAPRLVVLPLYPQYPATPTAGGPPGCSNGRLGSRFSVAASITRCAWRRLL